MRSYDAPGGREKLAREALLRRQINERMIGDRLARGEIYAPTYVIDYSENETFQRDHFARVVRPSRSTR
jgi:hypothetical protein